MREHSRRRDVGAANHQLALAMGDVSLVGRLNRVRDLAHESSLILVKTAAENLVRQKLIPKSADAPAKSILAAWRCLRELPNNCPDKKLFLGLVRESKTNADIKPFLDLVIRTWLISPAESVVESMGSVIEDIYGDHRQLTHDNAAKELVIRWNGPAVNKADDLISAVQARYHNNFLRKSVSIRRDFEGTVIGRHKRTLCPRSAVFSSVSSEYL